MRKSPKKKAESASSHAEEQVKVFLRLRPMDKLETSKRSKDCIELHDNPKLVTVDSPLLGTFDFTFEQVFDEYTPQEEVYKESLSQVPERVVNDGISCAVIAYGQTGTGKTHTMLGEGAGVEMIVRAKARGQAVDESEVNGTGDDTSGEASEAVLDPTKHPGKTEGMIPRIVQDIFRLLQTQPGSMEYTLRCSYVEIYLEKICDLIQPWREEIHIGQDDQGTACIAGASEICCLEPADVYALLARGNAYRTKADNDQNIDSSRSHAVFSLRLEKVDRSTGKQVSSRLHMLDLAGSELVKQKSARAPDTGLESRMINASLASVHNLIRGTLAQQGSDDPRFNPKANSNAAKLAQLLRPCFGGTWSTTLICTGSPSSYNINETINTVKFGQQAGKVKNTPYAQETFTFGTCRANIAKAHAQTSLVKILAKECQYVKTRNKGKDSGNVGLWEAIEEISCGDKKSTDVHVTLKTKAGNSDKTPSDDATVTKLKQELEECKAAKAKSESSFRDLVSDITSLRSQKETWLKEKANLEDELNEARSETKSLTVKLSELEHRLRTSQFREYESILFLRQFRTFYFRLLKSKAAQGSGSTREITGDVSKRIPGVSDLTDLMDVDQLMMDSGIVEAFEVGKDTNSPNYSPSEEALARSAEQAEKAEAKETEILNDEPATNSADEDSTSEKGPRISIVKRNESDVSRMGQIVAYRQRLLETPAGKLAIGKEQELEKDLVEMSKKLMTLQNSVVAEKAMVEALSARQGAMSKMKAAQELNTLKQEMERKTNDLHAIVWKMNELHLVNKTIDTKVENREHHVEYLEEHLVDLQTRNRRLVIERQESEKRLREENLELRNQIEGMTQKMWQLGDAEDAVPPWRFVVPYGGERVELAPPRADRPKRISITNLEDEIVTDMEVQVVTVDND